MKTGIYRTLANEQYHAGPGVSKSGLWTLHTKTPAHFKFPPDRDEDSTQARAVKDFGTAAHTAILEPNDFEARVMRGPEDRRGNKWKDAEEFAKGNGKIVLVAADFDRVLAVRDAAHANATTSAILTGGERWVESSGYWIDPATGKLCRCRPDTYRRDINLMLDLKSTESAHPDAFRRSVINYGYHAQEAFYSDGFRALDLPVDGFVFVAWEKKSPYAFALYELPPSIVEEGRAIMRAALDRFAECEAANQWPAYGDGVRELTFKRWDYQMIDAPEAIDREAA